MKNRILVGTIASLLFDMAITGAATSPAWANDHPSAPGQSSSAYDAAARNQVSGKGDGWSWHLDTSTGVLTLGGDNIHADKPENIWTGHHDSVRHIVFEPGSKAVGSLDYMFEQMLNLQTVDLTNVDLSGVTSLDYAFEECSELESVYIGTKKDAGVYLSGADLSGLKSKKGLFADCPKLKHFDLSDIDASSLKEGVIGWESPQLTTLNLERANLTGLTQLLMPRGNKTVEVVEAAGLQLSDSCRTIIGFPGCKNLKRADLSNWNTKGVEEIRSLFTRCYSLTDFDTTGWDTSNVTRMTSAFESCHGLEHIDLRHWDVSSVEDMRSMFNNCYSATSIDTSGWDTSSLKEAARCFRNCSSLKDFDLSHWNVRNLESAAYMFQECMGLTSVDLGTWRPLKLQSVYGMFEECENLKRLDLGEWKTPSLKDMGEFVKGCTRLKSIDVSKFDTSKVEDMHWAFGGCDSLQALDLSNFSAESLTDGRWAISGLSSLKHLDISGLGALKVQDINDKSDAFLSNCPSLISIVMPNAEFPTCNDGTYALDLPANRNWTHVEQNGRPAVGSPSLRAEELYESYPSCGAGWWVWDLFLDAHFDPAGGDHGPQPQVIDCTQDATLQASAPVRKGYRFAGWKLEGKLYQPDTSGNIVIAQADAQRLLGKMNGGAITLVAQWEPEPQPGPEREPEPQPEPEPEPEPQPEPQPNPHPKPEPNPQPQPEPEPEPQPEPEPDNSTPLIPLEPSKPVHPEPEPQPGPQPEPEPEPDNSTPLIPLDPAKPVQPEPEPESNSDGSTPLIPIEPAMPASPQPTPHPQPQVQSNPQSNPSNPNDEHPSEVENSNVLPKTGDPSLVAQAAALGAVGTTLGTLAATRRKRK